MRKEFGPVWVPRGLLFALVRAAFPSRLVAADAFSLLSAVATPGARITFPGPAGPDFAVLRGKLAPEKVIYYAVMPVAELVAADVEGPVGADCKILPPMDHPPRRVEKWLSEALGTDTPNPRSISKCGPNSNALTPRLDMTSRAHKGSARLNAIPQHAAVRTAPAAQPHRKYPMRVLLEPSNPPGASGLVPHGHSPTVEDVVNAHKQCTHLEVPDVCPPCASIDAGVSASRMPHAANIGADLHAQPTLYSAPARQSVADAAPNSQVQPAIGAVAAQLIANASANTQAQPTVSAAAGGQAQHDVAAGVPEPSSSGTTLSDIRHSTLGAAGPCIVAAPNMPGAHGWTANSPVTTASSATAAPPAIPAAQDPLLGQQASRTRGASGPLQQVEAMGVPPTPLAALRPTCPIAPPRALPNAGSAPRRIVNCGLPPRPHAAVPRPNQKSPAAAEFGPPFDPLAGWPPCADTGVRFGQQNPLAVPGAVALLDTGTGLRAGADATAQQVHLQSSPAVAAAAAPLVFSNGKPRCAGAGLPVPEADAVSGQPNPQGSTRRRNRRPVPHRSAVSGYSKDNSEGAMPVEALTTPRSSTESGSVLRTSGSRQVHTRRLPVSRACLALQFDEERYVPDVAPSQPSAIPPTLTATTYPAAVPFALDPTSSVFRHTALGCPVLYSQALKSGSATADAKNASDALLGPRLPPIVDANSESERMELLGVTLCESAANSITRSIKGSAGNSNNFIADLPRLIAANGNGQQHVSGGQLQETRPSTLAAAEVAANVGCQWPLSGDQVQTGGVVGGCRSPACHSPTENVSSGVCIHNGRGGTKPPPIGVPPGLPPVDTTGSASMSRDASPPAECSGSIQRSFSSTLAPVAPLLRTGSSASRACTPMSGAEISRAIRRTPAPVPVPMPSNSPAPIRPSPTPPARSAPALLLFKAPAPCPRDMLSYGALPLFAPSDAPSPTLLKTPLPTPPTASHTAPDALPPPTAVLVLRAWAMYGTEIAALSADFKSMLACVAPSCRERVAAWMPPTPLKFVEILVHASRDYLAKKDVFERDATSGAEPAMMLFDVCPPLLKLHARIPGCHSFCGCLFNSIAAVCFWVAQLFFPLQAPTSECRPLSPLHLKF
jgi:hypothetical protein